MTDRIPLAVADQHAAFLGNTGSGKTYASRGVVEDLLDAGRRVCVLDLTGAWWGLRSTFPVVVFGGDHGDVPISAASGPAVAALVAGHNMPCVIDLSELVIGDAHRFAEDFCRDVYRLNKLPLHLVIDEADEYAAQNPLPETRRLLHQVDRIVRRGRIKGFRVIMITQRPQALHKGVLTQASTLITLRLTAPQDRKAVEGWITGHGDDEAGAKVLRSLAGLERGEGWVWSPGLSILHRMRFPAIRSFDSGRTPEHGQDLQGPATLADVDLTAVRAAMQQATQEAEENDPKALKAEVRRLSAELAKAQRGASAEDLYAAEQRGRQIGAQVFLKNQIGRLNNLREEIVAKIDMAIRTLEPYAAPEPSQPEPIATPTPSLRPVAAQHSPARAAITVDLSPTVRKILDVIHRAHPVALTFEAASLRAGVSRRSSALRTYRRQVAASAEVAQREDGRFQSAPGFATAVGLGTDPVEEFANKLPPSYAAMLRAIAKSRTPLGRDQIAAAADVSPTSSGLSAGLRELTALSLVERDGDRFRLHRDLKP